MTLRSIPVRSLWNANKFFFFLKKAILCFFLRHVFSVRSATLLLRLSQERIMLSSCRCEENPEHKQRLAVCISHFPDLWQVTAGKSHALLLTDEGVIYSWHSEPVCHLKLVCFQGSCEACLCRFEEWLKVNVWREIAGDRTMTLASWDVSAARRQVLVIELSFLCDS